MFSEREKKIITIIGKKKLTLEEISVRLFKDSKDKPFDTTITVGNSVSRIIKKCSHHNLDWTLVKDRAHNKLIISKEKV